MIIENLQNGWYADGRKSPVLLVVAFFRFWDGARSDASEDGDDEDVDWEHEETTLYPHHNFLPGDFQRTWTKNKNSVAPGGLGGVVQPMTPINALHEVYCLLIIFLSVSLLLIWQLVWSSGRSVKWQVMAKRGSALILLLFASIQIHPDPDQGTRSTWSGWGDKTPAAVGLCVWGLLGLPVSQCGLGWL